MQLLPNGNYQIKNTKTGEVREVKPEELSSYGLSAPQATPSAQTPGITDMVTPQQPDQEQVKFQNMVRQAPDAKTANSLVNEWNTSHSFKLFDPYPLTDEQKKQQTNDIALKDKNDKVAKAASDFLDVYQTLSQAGDLTSEDAKRQLAFAAGKYNTIAGFGEGGKVLSAAELGILAPTLLKTQRQRGQNIIEKMTGTQPSMTKGLLEDNPAQAAEKMKLALKYTNPALLDKYGSIDTIQGGQSGDKSVGGLISNVGSNINSLLNMAISVPGELAEASKDLANQAMQNPAQVAQMATPQFLPTAIAQLLTKPGFVQNALKMPNQLFNDRNALAQNPAVDQVLNAAAPSELIGQMFTTPLTKGIANEYNQLAGDPLAGGDVVSRSLNRAYEKPVTTALDILPLTSLLKGNKVSKVGNSGVASDVSGRAATSVVTPVTDSVTLSEQLAKQALRLTQSNTARGMAKELESLVKTTGAKIDTYIPTIEKNIGAMPLNDPSGAGIMDKVTESVMNSPAARANPELAQQAIIKVESLLQKQTMPGLEGQGILSGTTLSSINEARKALNAGVKKWFTGGQSMQGKTNNLMSLDWDASQALKKILIESDPNGYLAKAIEAQHYALSTAPTLARQALNSAGGFGRFGIMKKMFNTITEPGKVAGARRMVGPADQGLQQILSGEIPAVQSTGGAVTGGAVVGPATQMTKQPLPQDIVQNALSSMGPAQANRLVRDASGNFIPDASGKLTPVAQRAAQNYLLNLIKKRKYK